MKKILLITVLGAMLVMVGCGAEADGEKVGEFADGSYDATASGHEGDITLEVLIEDGEIADIEILEEQETEGIADPAFESILEEVIENQGTEDVDTISGATATSEALLEAIETALDEA
ncbi:FMN-binding protein [Natranaerobius trueperi]|nr:FMN-binding protein [Natranaerobius trueperi]